MRLLTLRSALAALLILSAAAFAIGVAMERSSENDSSTHQEQTVPAAAEGDNQGSQEQAKGEAGTTDQHSESGETEAQRAAEGSTAGAAHSESSEKLFGINPESTGLVAVAILLSILLAAAVWWRWSSLLLIPIVAFGVVFAAFDIREAVHQSHESNNGLLATAIIVALLHFGVATLAGFVLLRRSNDGLATAKGE